ncbi:hypothetical protein D3C78_1686700 [compost metagenome]
MSGVGHRLQPRLGFRCPRTAEQPHRIEAHFGIGVAQLQVGQRDAERLMHPVVFFLRQALGQQR